MADAEDEEHGGQASSRDKALQQVADALGCALEDLKYDTEALADVQDTSELLGLWPDIGVVGRKRILELARLLARSQ